MVLEWYVLRTYYAQEQHAAQELTNLEFETFLPLARTERRQRGGLLVAKIKPLFSSYLFVKFDRYDRRWQQVCSALGVKGFIGYLDGQAHPSTVPEKHMQELRDRLDEYGGVVPMGLSRPKVLNAGQLVLILFGPFREQSAIVQADCGSRVEVLLRFAGAPRAVKIPKQCLAVAG